MMYSIALCWCFHQQSQKECVGQETNTQRWLKVFLAMGILAWNVNTPTHIIIPGTQRSTLLPVILVKAGIQNNINYFALLDSGLSHRRLGARRPERQHFLPYCISQHKSTVFIIIHFASRRLCESSSLLMTQSKSV